MRLKKKQGFQTSLTLPMGCTMILQPRRPKKPSFVTAASKRFIGQNWDEES